MKLIQIFRQNGTYLLPFIFVISLAFIYGCRCEGGIGTSSESTENIEIISTQLENK